MNDEDLGRELAELRRSIDAISRWLMRLTVIALILVAVAVVVAIVLVADAGQVTRTLNGG